MPELNNESDCRLAFYDIINGYSYNAGGNCFVKHYTELDFCRTEQVRYKSSSEAEKLGLLTEKEKLKLIIDYGHWSKEEEESYNNSLDELNGLRNSLSRLIIPQQKLHMQGMIKEKEKEFQTKHLARSNLLASTREQFSGRRASEFHVVHGFYKDSTLQVPLFTGEEIDNLSDKDFNILIDIYNSTHSIFTERNLKKIAVCHFFLNLYTLSDGNPQVFFGKPLIELTIYQTALFSRGAYYKDIIQDSHSQKVPEEYYEDLNKVIIFYDQQYSLIISKRNAENTKR